MQPAITSLLEFGFATAGASTLTLARRNEFMTMTKNERLLLINQYEILAVIKPDEAHHYMQLSKILTEGYEIFYDTIDEWIDEGMSESESRFVLDVLDLYRVIEDFKLKSQSAEIAAHSLSYFRGFDGNNEGSYLSFTRFLIEDQGKFSEQRQYFPKNDRLNSHMTMVDNYRRMLHVWSGYGRSFDLTEEQVLAILEA